MISTDIVVVIRSVGERTQDWCKAIVESQVSPALVHVVTEIPFEKTLRRCYEIGASSKATWMITLDADVLLFPNAIASLVQEAAQLPHHFIQMEGRVYDHVFGQYRRAGFRIYRTRFLKYALRCLPKEGTQLRPETFTLKQLAKHGFPSRGIDTAYGFHDFEQYYADLYRKAFIQSRKFSGFMAGLLFRAMDLRDSNPDFKIIYRAIEDATRKPNTLVSVDKNLFSVFATTAMQELVLIEKAPLPDWNLSNPPAFYRTIPETDELQSAIKEPASDLKFFNALSPVRFLTIRLLGIPI